MIEYIEILGGTPLRGDVQIGGAKNAVLPMLMGSLLTAERCTFTNVPAIEDVSLAARLLEQFGSEVEYFGDTVSVTTPRLLATEASYSLVKALRASFWVLGPLLARGRAARVALPGGDIIGARPVDIHLAGLTKMGAEISVRHGIVLATAVSGLKPAEIDLRFASVGATHQLMMAAALTPGTSVIRGAAREPEVVAVANMLIAMGADIEGAGTPTIVIRGRESLGGVSQKIIGDRIEAATYLLAGLASGGAVRACGISPDFFGEFIQLLSQMGCDLEATTDSLSARCPTGLKPVKACTGPFPAFATDLQALLMATLALAPGESRIEENIFEGRFGHVSELCRMGAQIRIEDRTAIIDGISRYTGAPVEAHDIRAAAALVIAAVSAEGKTQIQEPQHLRRGYEHFERKLCGLGATVGLRVSDAEDYLLSGC